MSERGYFGIGIYHGKTEVNVGTLWRSATLYGAAFVYTVGKRYQRQCSDTPKTPMHTPLFHFADIEDLHAHLPFSCPLVGVELSERSVPLAASPNDWERCVYLLGAEDHGLPRQVLDRCHQVVQIETLLPQSMNVAVAGSIVLHDRHVKRSARRMAVAS